MSETDTLTLLSNFLKERAGTKPEKITRDATLASVNIDSLMLLELVFEFEEKFGISIPNDFPAPANVGELVDFVDQIRAKAAEQAN